MVQILVEGILFTKSWIPLQENIPKGVYDQLLSACKIAENQKEFYLSLLKVFWFEKYVLIKN